MTPPEYIGQLDASIAAARDEEALALAARMGPWMTPRLNAAEFFQVRGLLEGARLAVDVTEAIRERDRRQVSPGVTSTAP